MATVAMRTCGPRKGNGQWRGGGGGEAAGGDSGNSVKVAGAGVDEGKGATVGTSTEY